MPDILCVQEHKLRLEGIPKLQRELWRTSHCIIAEAIDGQHAARNGTVLGGKGGVALIISTHWQPYLISKGILPSLRGLGLYFNTHG
jgi:hypothetical protein